MVVYFTISISTRGVICAPHSITCPLSFRWLPTPLFTIPLLVSLGCPDKIGHFYVKWQHLSTLGFHSNLNWILIFSLALTKFIKYVNRQKLGTILYINESSEQFGPWKKVSKSVSWNSIAKKNQNIKTKSWPLKLGQNFVKCFIRFLGNGVSKKNAFEIYWPLGSLKYVLLPVSYS